MRNLLSVNFSVLDCIVSEQKGYFSQNTLQDYINFIKDSTTKQKVQNPSKNLNEIKQQDLKIFMLAGIFRNRTNNGCMQYSKIQVIDIDKIENLDEIKNVLVNDEDLKPFLIHKSASGKGLRVFYSIDCKSEDHTMIYKRISNYLKLRYNMICDEACSNISRLWCISYDPDFYLSSNIENFESYSIEYLNDLIEKNQYSNQNLLDEFENRMDNLFRSNMIKNQKHHSLLKIACHAGAWVRQNYVSFSEAEKYLFDKISTYNINSESAAIKTIKNGISYGINNFYDFDISKPESYGYDHVKFNQFLSTRENTYFFNKIADKLPIGLRKFIEQYEADHVKDFMFIGLLTAISSCLASIYFLYDGKKTYPMLFSLLLAPAAQGKGKLDKIKLIFEDVNLLIDAHNKTVKEDIDADKNSKNKDKYVPKKRHLFGANFSNAAMIDTLRESDEVGFIMDSESDTLSNNHDKEWANNSTLLRKLHSNEGEISLRKNEDSEFKNPRVAVLLTGTPGQVFKLFTDVENGLFSRFAILKYIPKRKFSIRRMRIEFDFEYLDVLSKHLVNFHPIKNKSEVELIMSDELFDKHFKYFEKLTDELEEINLQDHGAVNRTAVGVYKLASILTILKGIEENYTPTHFDSEMFDLALEISECLLDMSFEIIEDFSKQTVTKGNINNEAYQILFDNLPKQFKTSDAIELSANKIPERTLKSYLKRDIRLKSIKHGSWVKICPKI